jgi:hypothetical protein
MTARNLMPIWVFSKGKCYVEVRPSMRAWVIATVLTVATVAIAQTEPIDPSDINVLDGDTIAVFKMQPNVRLVGFNAPETDRAVCPTERELGLKARDRLRALVGAGNLTFEYVDCSCPSKTQGTFACNYGSHGARSPARACRRGDRMKRREFITLLGSALSVFLCVSASAQEGYYGAGHDKWHQGFYSTLAEL